MTREEYWKSVHERNVERLRCFEELVLNKWPTLKTEQERLHTMCAFYAARREIDEKYEGTKEC